jgi:hypothetical protein
MYRVSDSEAKDFNRGRHGASKVNRSMAGNEPTKRMRADNSIHRFGAVAVERKREEERLTAAKAAATYQQSILEVASWNNGIFT